MLHALMRIAPESKPRFPNVHSDDLSYKYLSAPAYRGAFIGDYDSLRPRPPSQLIAVLLQLSLSRRPRLVVDLGSGTGLSTVVWADHADHVIGIEENDEMLAAAREADRVEYRHAGADATGLPTGSADIVTCAQSFHWMPRQQTLAEAARVLRPGGLFAAFDYDWPPLVDWEIDQAFTRLIAASGVDTERPEKAGHLRSIAESGCFRAWREFFIHGVEVMEAERLMALPLAFGPVARRLTEQDKLPELSAFQGVVEQRIGRGSVTAWWAYRVRAALK